MQTCRICSAEHGSHPCDTARFAELELKLIPFPQAFGKVKLQEGCGLCPLLTPQKPCRALVWAGRGVMSPR